MMDPDDIKTPADGWLSFLDKLAQIGREAEKRGLTEIVENTKTTATAVAKHLNFFLVFLATPCYRTTYYSVRPRITPSPTCQWRIMCW